MRVLPCSLGQDIANVQVRGSHEAGASTAERRMHEARHQVDRLLRMDTGCRHAATRQTGISPVEEAAIHESALKRRHSEPDLWQGCMVPRMESKHEPRQSQAAGSATIDPLAVVQV